MKHYCSSLLYYLKHLPLPLRQDRSHIATKKEGRPGDSRPDVEHTVEEPGEQKDKSSSKKRLEILTQNTHCEQ